jgi:hypothetical protein
MYAVNEVISALFFLIDPSTGNPATGKTVTAIVYDETFTQFSTPTVTEIAGGLYYAQFTPDTAGVWTIKFSCASPAQYGGLTFPVGLGNEALLANGTYGLSALNTDLDALLARLTAARAGYLDNLSAGAAALEATLTAIKGAGWSTETLKVIKDAITALNNISATDVEGKVENAVDAGNLTHDITTVNDKTETQIVEIAKAGIYALSVFLDLDVLETAVEGGTVKIRVYNKIDGTNYSDKPSAYAEYVVGQENEYPSVEINLVHGYCKVTIQCSTDVTVTRTIAYRHIERDLGA